ncbi:MAG: hypothetical protein JO100_07945 [Pseudonocardia sp.]|nr:hypothetical protein [Pseudonocardia sp.]
MRETIAVHRRLAEMDYRRFAPDLPCALEDEPADPDSDETSSPAARLEYRREAVALWRELADWDADRYLPELARSLQDMACALAFRYRSLEVLPVQDEAIMLHRQLKAGDALWFRARLADSLSLSATDPSP